MSVVSPLTLLLLGALVHGSCAIDCYVCGAEYHKECDDDPVKRTCPSVSNACGTLKGSVREEGETKSGEARFCFISSESKCEKVSNQRIQISGFDFEIIEADFCVCTSNLCNSAPRRVPTGHLMVIFIGVVCLLALTTQRLLSR